MTPASEGWRPVLGFEGYYEVSDRGQVRSLPRRVTRSDGRPRTIPGRVLTPAIREGRQAVNLWRGNQAGSRRVYTLVLEAFVGPRPDGMEGCHNDGDSLNDALANLRWDTRQGNVADAVAHGTLANTQKTECPYGHRLSAPNLVASQASDGYRGCRACNTARSARRRARQRGLPFDMQHESDLIYDRIMQRETS